MPKPLIMKFNMINNEGISAVSFCHQVAAWFPDMFCNFYLVKIHKLLKTQQPLKIEKKQAQTSNP
jgi:hypothetical protein